MITFCVILVLLLVICDVSPTIVIGDGAVCPAMYSPLTFLMSRLDVRLIVPPTSNTTTRPPAGKPLSRTALRSVPGVVAAFTPSSSDVTWYTLPAKTALFFRIVAPAPKPSAPGNAGLATCPNDDATGTVVK